MVSAWVSHRCLWLVGSSEATSPYPCATAWQTVSTEVRGLFYLLTMCSSCSTLAKSSPSYSMLILPPLIRAFIFG